MPQKVNLEKSDLSVSLGTKLKRELAEACDKDDISLTQATKEAVRRWLAAREKRIRRGEQADKR